jgi:hypothetical protein
LANQLDHDQKIILFKLICGHRLAYKYKKKDQFWRDIIGIFKKETGKKHKTLEQVVKRECEKREKYLDKCGTGEELSKDTLNALIDEWRDIQKEKEEVENQANSFAKDNKKS